MNVHPREKILRGCILVTLTDAPFAVAAKLLPYVPYFVGVIFVVLGSVSGAVVALFYAAWTFGWLAAMDRNSPTALIGEDGHTIPQPYWPWSRRITRLRQSKRIAELERSVGFYDGRFYR